MLMAEVYLTEYAQDTGEIVGCYACPDQGLPYIELGPVVTGQYDGALYYYDLKARTIKPRPQMSLSTKGPLSVPVGQSLYIKGIPTGASCSIAGETFTMDPTGALDWSSTVPIKDTLHIELFPYIPVDIEVEVTA